MPLFGRLIESVFATTVQHLSTEHSSSPQCLSDCEQARLAPLDSEGSDAEHAQSKKTDDHRPERLRIAIFGHFSEINLGNDSTLQALIYQIRQRLPEVELSCICSDPLATAKLFGIRATCMDGISSKLSRRPANAAAKVLRKLIIGVPAEINRWRQAQKALEGVDVVIVAGTGLLTDICGLRNWGPYTLFKWSLLAKLRDSKLMFLSVGAGPLYRRSARWLVALALSFADFRSYRDETTKQYLRGIGVRTAADNVYPDLAFSLPSVYARQACAGPSSRRVVGLGLMLYSDKQSASGSSEVIYKRYLDALLQFAEWLLAEGYNIRLLSGDKCDQVTVEEFKERLNGRHPMWKDCILYEPLSSVDDLLRQLLLTDIVVATRFHNVLLALALHRPVISISFHQKCFSLMSDMGLSEYCHDIVQLRGDWLISQFRNLESKKDRTVDVIRQETDKRRALLEEQYACIVRYLKDLPERKASETRYRAG